jgi:RecB family exonuclease
MPDKKPHISQTQLESLCRCPEAYRRRYIEGERIPPGIALLKGSAFHKGAETNFRQKLASHEDLPVDEIKEATAAAFESSLAGSYSLSEEEVSRGAAVTLGEAKDAVVALAEIHAEHQAPDYQPVLVEQPVTIVLPSASRDLLGIIDLADDKGRVVDLKTSGKKKNQNEADTSVQLTVYAAPYHAKTGGPPAELRLDTIVQSKKSVSRDVLTTDRGTADFRALANRINVALHIIDAGIFLPASPGSWWCASRWCGFWSTCRFVNSERKAKAVEE